MSASELRQSLINAMLRDFPEHREATAKYLEQLAGKKDAPTARGAFDSLPWKTNNWSDWIFSNLPEAAVLKAKIGTAKSWTDVDGWEYSISGEAKFINRTRRGRA